MSDVASFAARVLHGRTLDDKLVPPGRLSDRVRGPAAPVPEGPGRPPDLRPVRLAGRRKPPVSVATDRDRGRVLHAFANHELLALELLALALLRFPDAPRGLRRAWLSTLADEQRHCAAYLERMRACGVELGEEPVSSYFWDALSGAPDALRFTTGLALVLEQANLDFSLRWQRAFAEAGDAGTAGVLHEVYEDEVRHVRTGVRWLRRLKDPDRSDWDAFTAALIFPLTPARARGTACPLDREGRRRAGLGEDFVRELVAAGASKGRVPDVYLFDPHVEDAIAGRTGRSPVASDLAALPILLAGADDVVVAPPPRPAFLEGLAAAGFPIPQIVGEAVPDAFPNGRWGELRPWGWSPATAAALAALGGRWDPRHAVLSDKTWAAERLRELDPRDAGEVCRTMDEVERAIRGPSVVKAPFSTAGGHRIRADRLDDAGRRWVARHLDRGPLLVEPWLDVVAELSVQAEVAGEVRILGVTRFLSASGVYRGTVIGPPHVGLPSDVRRFLHDDGRDPGRVERELARAATHVGRAAASLGYRGPLGVDALIVRGPDGLRLKPISEVNARCTMGRVALALRGRCRPGTVGTWRFLPVRTFGDRIEDAVRRWPIVMEGGRIRRGALATTDPVGAKALVTVLWVAERWEEAEASARLA